MNIVYVDEREKNSRVPEILMAKGVTIIFKILDVGDYVIGDAIGIERKTADDYINSLIDKRLLNQLSRLREKYDIAILIIEGDIHKAIKNRKIHRNAILGSYASLILDLGVNMINTLEEEETAEVIKRLALHKVQLRRRYPMIIPQKPKLSSVTEWQLFILQCFPHIGPKTARRILEYFGSINVFCNASPQELSRIEGLSERKAGEIYQIIRTLYKDRDQNRSSGQSSQQKSILDYVNTQ